MEKWSMSCSEYASRQLRRYEEIMTNFKNKFRNYHNKRNTMNFQNKEEKKCQPLGNQPQEKSLLMSSTLEPRRSSVPAHSSHNNSNIKDTPNKRQVRDSVNSTQTKKSFTSSKNRIPYNIHEKTCMGLDSTKKSKYIPNGQSYVENDAEIEKRIKDLTKMLKEKIENILLLERKNKEISEMLDKTSLQEAKLRAEAESFGLYETENKLLKDELMDAKGQILLNKANILSVMEVDNQLRDSEKKVVHQRNRLHYYNNLEDKEELADNFRKDTLKKNFLRACSDAVKFNMELENIEGKKPAVAQDKMREFFSIWKKTHFVSVKIKLLQSQKSQQLLTNFFSIMRRQVSIKKYTEARDLIRLQNLQKQFLQILGFYGKERKATRKEQDNQRQLEKMRILEIQETQRKKEEAMFYTPDEERQRSKAIRRVLMQNFMGRAFLGWKDNYYVYYEEKQKIKSKRRMNQLKKAVKGLGKHVVRIKDFDEAILAKSEMRKRNITKRTFEVMKKQPQDPKFVVLDDRLKKYWTLLGRRFFKTWLRKLRHKRLLEEHVKLIQKKSMNRKLKKGLVGLRWMIHWKKSTTKHLSAVMNTRRRKKLKAYWSYWQKNIIKLQSYYTMKDEWKQRQTRLFFDHMVLNHQLEKRGKIMLGLLASTLKSSYKREYGLSFKKMQIFMLKGKRTDSAYNNLVSQINLSRKKKIFGLILNNYQSATIEKRRSFDKEGQKKKQDQEDTEDYLKKADYKETDLDNQQRQLKQQNEDLTHKVQSDEDDLRELKKLMESLATELLFTNEDVKENKNAFEVNFFFYKNNRRRS